MCDTILATPTTTVTGVMLFGKNSDRQRNEAQGVEIFAGSDYPQDRAVSCTYISIPQARRTHATILCRPFWIWGAEMGTNEYGVAIGNEGLHARIPAEEKKALTGMDLLRLALERAISAAEAVEVITTLLEQFGQGGNCGHLRPDYYNNGFIVADPAEAFVLETVGREWLVERVAGVRSISNVYSIARGPERVSRGLSALIRDSGWTDDPRPSYASVIANPHREHIGQAGLRSARSSALLRSMTGELNAAIMMRILRDHGASSQSRAAWSPEHTTERSLCAHAGAEDRPGQTVGSMVSELSVKNSVHWVTGTAAPCISIFKPVLIDVPLPAHGPRPIDSFTSDALWWRHERMHRAALGGEFAEFHKDIVYERDSVEADFRTRVSALMEGASAVEREKVIHRCWQEAIETEDRWFTRMPKTPVQEDGPYRATWSKMNRLAGVQAEIDPRDVIA